MEMKEEKEREREEGKAVLCLLHRPGSPRLRQNATGLVVVVVVFLSSDSRRT